MNAHQWLERATRELPEGVARRVERETRAHLQDAELPEGADVLAVLGDPETTNDGLRRLYLTAKELDTLTGSSTLTGFHLTQWMAGLVLPAALLTATIQNDSVVHGLSLGVYLAVLALTWDLHLARRRQWWMTTMLTSLSLLDWIPDLWERFGWDSRSLWVVLPSCLVFIAQRRLTYDARLRRTLLVEEGRA